MTPVRVHDHWAGTCPLCGPSLYVWVQGCPRRCPGCANQAALDMSGPAHDWTPHDIWRRWRENEGGLVLSGGEPFSQASGLAEACRLVRATSAEAPILVYTGYRLDELLTGRDPAWIELLRAIDVLVDGPYMQERQCDFPLTGSDNQRVFLLSGRRSPEQVGALRRARLDVQVAEGGHFRMVGSGHRSMNMNELVAALAAKGVVLE
jgi:anaerobic ribonucleoside-triphosphate reductase activating protein